MFNLFSKTKKCPKCNEDIDKNANICPLCKFDDRSWINRHPLKSSAIMIGTTIFCLSIIGWVESMPGSAPANTQEENVKHIPFDNSSDLIGIEQAYKTESYFCNDYKGKKKTECLQKAEDKKQRMLEIQNSKKKIDEIVTIQYSSLVSECKDNLRNIVGGNPNHITLINGEIWGNTDSSILLRSYVGTTAGLKKYMCKWSVSESGVPIFDRNIEEGL